MREIKFRAWDKYEIYYNQYNDDSSKMIQDIRLDNRKIFTSLEHFDIMQYTGLKDKNGVEIYEGDLIVYSTTNGVHSYAEVIFDTAHMDTPCFCLNADEGLFNFHDSNDKEHVWYEVIGNIYENKDLLS